MIFPNTIKIGATDHQCLLSNEKAHVNYINCAFQDSEWSETAKSNFITLMDEHPKLCYKVKEIFGDYYYEKMSKEETISKAFY